MARWPIDVPELLFREPFWREDTPLAASLRGFVRTKPRLGEWIRKQAPTPPINASPRTPVSERVPIEGRVPDAADRRRPGQPAGRQPGTPRSAAAPRTRSGEPPPTVPSRSRLFTVSTLPSTTSPSARSGSRHRPQPAGECFTHSRS